jgi:outer membrane biosynthesis protein TonB
MKDLDKVDQSEMREAIRDLNGSGLVTASIKVVGVKKEVLVKQFTDAVEGVPDDQTTKLPASVVKLYNFLYEDEDETPADPEEAVEPEEEEIPDPEPTVDKEEEQGESPVKGKRGRPAKEPKEKKEKKPRDPNAPKRIPPKREGPKGPFGSFLDSQAGKIEVALAEGGSIETIMEASGASRARIASHIRYLKEKKSIVITKGEDGVYKAA